jgi:hypothetical protein
MDAARAGTVLSVTLVVATLVATGPLVGPGPGDSGSGLGEGTASVEEVSLGTGASMTPGRFGTGVVYLRIPVARVALSDVEGRSRLVYRVAVPELGFDRVGTRTVAPGSTRATVGMSDRAFAPATVNASTYRVRVSVRVQSFAIDRTVFDRNVSVRAPDG